MDPSEQQLKSHLGEPVYQIGVVEGRWGEIADKRLRWPVVLFWVQAITRPEAPEHYFVRVDLTSYPLDPPTGTFWDAENWQPLPSAHRPYGKGQVGRVFRVDWKGGQAFYHPYDRLASRDGHTQWANQYPHLVWSEQHTITDYLSVISELLHSSDYEGVRGGR